MRSRLCRLKASTTSILFQGLRRLALVDYDVHHGFGTEQIFMSDPGALFISVNQDGDALSCKEQTDRIINISLPPGSEQFSVLNVARVIYY